MKMANDNTTSALLKIPLHIAAFLCPILFTLAVHAETVEVKLPNGLTALANFQAGVPTQTALIFLHGLHQTQHSQPLSALANNLSAKGYTLLNPTLTVSVNRRVQSMDCEAVHTQTMDQDVAEIDYWVHWLTKKGYPNIALIGFSSTGNIQAMLYNSLGSNSAIKKTILISMNPLLIDLQERQSAQKILVSNHISKINKLSKYKVGYCKNNFVSTSNIYMSYAKYDAGGILTLLTKTSANTELIFGSADLILPANWISQVRAVNSQVTISIIDKANHFFDGTSEFDLAAKVETILSASKQQRS